MFHSPACRHRSAQSPPGRAPYFDRNLAEAFFAFPFLSRFFRLSRFSAFSSFSRFFKKQKPLRRRECHKHVFRPSFNCFLFKKISMINLFFNIVSHPRSIFALNLSRNLSCMNVSNEQKFCFKIFPEYIWIIIFYHVLHDIPKLCKK